MEPTTVYLAVKASYVGGKFVYEQADKKVQDYASVEGISKQEAWQVVRAEARRSGDRAVEESADRILKLGLFGVALVPGGSILYAAALARKAILARRAQI